MVPILAPRRDVGAAQGCWGTDGGLEGAGPCSIPNLVLDFGLPRKGVMALWPPQLQGPALCMDADLSLECRAQAAIPGGAAAGKLCRGHSLTLQVVVK